MAFSFLSHWSFLQSDEPDSHWLGMPLGEVDLRYPLGAPKLGRIGHAAQLSPNVFRDLEKGAASP